MGGKPIIFHKHSSECMKQGNDIIPLKVMVCASMPIFRSFKQNVKNKKTNVYIL